MTIDPQLQQLAQGAADRRLSEVEAQKGYPHPKKKDYVPASEGEEEKPTSYIQAAAVVVDNKTGAIRAVVGGRDFQQSKYSRALLSRRQIGSTFKPFVYAAAFEHGMLPGTMVDDSKIAPGEFRDIPKKWSPENSDGEYNGPQPAATGLIKSRNTMSVRVGEFAGLSRVRQLGLAADVSDKIPGTAGCVSRWLRDERAGSDGRIHDFPESRHLSKESPHLARGGPGWSCPLQTRPD
jgi:penicillin-binding protein 1A